jgi:HD-like signal output (HDOD) protein
MDPLTAVANLVTALTKFATVIAESQTPEQRQQIWDWYIQDVAWWRKKLRIDE